MLFDSAQNFEIIKKAEAEYHLQTYSLFVGNLHPTLAEVSPYLICFKDIIDIQDEMVFSLRDDGGILIESSVEAYPLLAHCRELFVVEGEGCSDFFFRYYDPRVFRPYIQSLSQKDLQDFFGPILSFTCVNEDGEGFSQYTIGQGGLVFTQIEPFPNLLGEENSNIKMTAK